MSKLYWEKKFLHGPRLAEASIFPAIREPIKSTTQAELGEDDGLFLNYGMFADSLPYTLQDSYDGPPELLELDAVILENEHLKAEFIPALGGRLWSLYDKDSQRELLVNNPEFRPGNLAIRNAWVAGGVEWNIGRRGHDAQTCSPRFFAVLNDRCDTPVLRMYEFNRDRAVPFQVDFFLPDNAEFLYVRVRISNVNAQVVPMYWWSNIAVEEVHGGRVVVPAENCYANHYSGGNHFLTRLDLPFGEGFDATYPEHFWDVKDHFYNISDRKRKYISFFRPDGTGFVHCSTRRLQGRKLFVWGNSPGGRHWQRKLLPEGMPDYLELQAGLCKTQQECLPMPPKTTWEWLEAYGPINMPTEKIFGAWTDAIEAVTAELNRILPETKLDAVLSETRSDFATRPGTVVFKGSGWGALEEYRSGKKLAAHLDFGTITAEQQEWHELRQTGKMTPDMAPLSFQVQDEWGELLHQVSKRNWKTEYHLALNYYRHNDMDRALATIEHSVKLTDNAWNRHARGYIHKKIGNARAAAADWEKCISFIPENASLSKDILKALLEMEDYGTMLRIIARLNPNVQTLPMIQFLHAAALAHTDAIDVAEAIITAGGGLDIPDIREGENSIAELYLYIRRRQAERAGIPYDPESEQVPRIFDYRMESPRQGNESK